MMLPRCPVHKVQMFLNLSLIPVCGVPDCLWGAQALAEGKRPELKEEAENNLWFCPVRCAGCEATSWILSGSTPDDWMK